MRGVVAGISPSLEEAAQTLRADRCDDLPHHHAAAAQARAWPTPSWSASSRASPTSATRSSSAASSRAVDRHLLRHRRRAVRPGPRRLAGAGADGLRARRLRAAAQRARQGRLHDRLRQGRRRRADGAARRAVARHAARSSCRGWRSRSSSTCSRSPAASSQTWGRDYTPTLRHFITAFDIQWGNAESAAAWSGPARRGTRSSRP